MSAFKEIDMISPRGESEKVLELKIDKSGDGYILDNVIKLANTYTFSIWVKALANCNVTFEVLGHTFTMNATTEWKKFSQTVVVKEVVNNTQDIVFKPDNNTTTYYYEGFLVEGEHDNSWLPAPEDADANMQAVKSELIQRAESIEARVSNNEGNVSSLRVDLDGITGVVGKKGENFTKLQQDANNIRLEAAKKKDTIPTRIRYIRDYLNGNDRDDTNVFCKIQVFANETNLQSGTINLAKGVIPTSDVAITNPENYTDDGENSLETFTTLPSGNHYLQLDLSTTRASLERVPFIPNVDSIKIWHHTDGRKCNHKLQVSEDGTNWYTVYDSDTQGAIPENLNGVTHYIADKVIADEISYLNIGLKSIDLRVADSEGKYSEMAGKVDGFSTTVSDVKKLTNETIPKLDKDLSDKISVIDQKADGIKSTVTTIQGDMKTQSEQILEAGKWEVHLANIGAYDKSKATQEVSMKLDGNGLTIDRTNAGGYATQITGDTIKISYFDGAVSSDAMVIDKDKMRLSRLYVNNGIEHGTIKEVPITYGNVTALAFIASKGSIA